jgi:DNA-binding MarR family transcriptional regulator
MHVYDIHMKKTTRMDMCNCFAARQAARHMTRFYEREMVDSNLTSAQFSILVLLDENEDMSMTELADRMSMDRTTLLRALKPMQRDGLLTNQRQNGGVGDPRSHVLNISSSGIRRLKLALDLWVVAQRKLESAIGPARAARLRDDLRAVSQMELTV